MPPSEPSTEELYAVVRRGVRDGIWDVVDTILTVALTLVVALVGVGFAAQGLQATGPRGWLAVAFGVVLTGVAAVYLLRELDVLRF